MFHVKHVRSLKGGQLVNVASEKIWKRLSEQQRAQLVAYERELLHLNGHVNLISRATAQQVHQRHVLHCLTLAGRPFPEGARLVDWGTGGGLPAIPLAIAFPHVTIHAVDTAKKKIWAVRKMARQLGLENVQAWTGQADEWPGSAHFSVSRAVAPLVTLWRWHARIGRDTSHCQYGDAWRPGLVCLKGGDLDTEITSLKDADPEVQVERFALDGPGSMYDGKAVIHVFRTGGR